MGFIKLVSFTILLIHNSVFCIDEIKPPFYGESGIRHSESVPSLQCQTQYTGKECQNIPLGQPESSSGLINQQLLTKISLKSHQILSLEWELSKEQHEVQGFKLEINCLNTTDWSGCQNASLDQPPICRLFDQSNAVLDTDKLYFVYDCYTVEAGLSYNVVLTTLPEEVSTTYILSVPTDISNATKESPPKFWQPVVAVGATSNGCRDNNIHVLFSAPVPTSSNDYSDIAVSLNDTIGLKDLTQEVPWNQTSAVFHVPAELSYQAQVRAISPSCSDGCPYETNSTSCCASFSKLLHVEKSSLCTTLPVILPSLTMSSPSVSSSPTSILDNIISTTKDPSVTMQKTQEQATYERNVTIIATTISIAMLAALVSAIAFCLYRRKRQRPGVFDSVGSKLVNICLKKRHPDGRKPKKKEGSFYMQRMRTDHDSDTSSVAMEKATTKSPPSVLLLYSFDCDAHERVIIEFASYLKHECDCEVFLDIWAQADIQSRGATQWWNEKLDTCQFTVVISSAGARFKCNRKKPFKMKQERPVPDMFVYGVNQVAEKLRFAKNNGNHMPQCPVVCFEYTTQSDIPPKLDTLQRFSLMKEMQEFYCLLHEQDNSNRDRSSFYGRNIESYSNTVTGKQLYEALKDANQFFKDNPDWLGRILEPLSPHLSSSQSSTSTTNQEQKNDVQKSDSNSSDKASDSEQSSPVKIQIEGDVVDAPPVEETQTKLVPSHSRMSSNAASVTSEDENLLLERKKKRQKEEEIRLDKVPSFNKLAGLDTTQSCVENGSKVHSLPKPESSRPKDSPRKFKEKSRLNVQNSGHSANGEFVLDMDEEEDEMAQLQKDIDFIHNYQWHNVTEPTDQLLQMDFDPAELTPSFDEASPFSFSNPLYAESGTKHMLLKNGLGRVSVALKSKKPSLNNNSTFVVDFMAKTDTEQDSTTHL